MAAQEGWPSPSKALGAAIGSLTVLAFALLHALLIVGIWDQITPMVIAGALCGLSVVWSYGEAVAEHSARRWLAYNAGSVVLDPIAAKP